MRRLRVLLVLALLPLRRHPPEALVRTRRRARPRNASYTLEATLDPASRTLTGIRAADLAQHLAPAGDGAALSPVLERLAGREVVVDARARSSSATRGFATRPAEDWASIDLTRLAIAGGADLLPRAASSSRPTTAMRTIGRCSRCRSTGRSRPARRSRSSSAGRRACRARSRERAPSATTSSSRSGFPKIGVLDDSGWNCHQFHAATEFFADFGIYDVSLTVPHGLDRRRDRTRAVEDRPRERHQRPIDTSRPTCTTSRGRRARTSSSARERFEEPGLPPVDIRLLLQPEHAEQARSAFRRDARRAQVLRRLVRPVSVRAHHGRRSGHDLQPARAGRGHGRHGVPDADHGGHALVRALARHAAGERDGPRSRPSVLVRRRRHQRVRARVDGRRAEHVLARRACWRRRGRTVRDRRTLLRRTRCRGRTPDVRWSREVDGNRLNAFRPVAGFDAQSTPTWQYWPGVSRARSATPRRRCGWRRSNG